jgi:hypothetical protein
MSILGTFWRAIAPSKDGEAAVLSGNPRTLSQDLLIDLTGACELPLPPNANGHRDCWRVPIGTRGTIRLAFANSVPVSLVVRDISAIGAGLLFENPMRTGQKFWLYLPKAHAPEEIVGICCVALRCDRGGAFKELYSIGASFIEGEAPKLILPEQSFPKNSTPVIAPNRLEEEGGHSPNRIGSSIFLPSIAPTPEPEMAAPASAEICGPVQAVVAQIAPAPAAPLQITPAQIAPAAYTTPVVEPAVTEPVSFREIPLPPLDETSALSANPDANPANLTPDQRRRIAKVLKRQQNYLNRLVGRMNEMQRPQADPLLARTLAARTATEDLLSQLSQPLAGENRVARKRRSKRAAKGKATAAAPIESVKSVESVESVESLVENNVPLGSEEIVAGSIPEEMVEELQAPKALINRNSMRSIDSRVNIAVKGVNISMPRWSLEVADATN